MPCVGSSAEALKKAHSNEWTFFSEVTGGDRTHDNRNHNPGLYH